MQFTSLYNILANVNNDIEEDIISISIQTVLFASLLLIFLLLISSRIIKKKKFKHYKKPLFILIALAIVLPSIYLTGSTIYLNTISDSKGPVHWHTDIEFWVCGQEIELRNPTGTLSNKIGSSTYHEHNDKRIHLEGVVINKEYDASLDKFMSVIGGEITSSRLVIPTEASLFEDDIDGDKISGSQEAVKKFAALDGESTSLILENSNSCQSDNSTAEYNEPAEIQAFLFQFNKENDTYDQTKIASPATYTMRDESVVPPGDCLIIEYDVLKQRTDKLCQQYGIRDANRCVEFGVSEFNPKLCNIQEVFSGQDKGDSL